MRDVIKAKIKSTSIDGQITNYIECELCGKKISCRSISSPESQKDLSKEQQIIRNAMFERDKERELSALVRKTTETFSLCPICHKLVCDDCFCVCDDLDMCQECADRLQAKGSVVTEQSAKA